MKPLVVPAAFLVALTLFPSRPGALRPSAEKPPPPPREFRGVWVATVANIDWPSRPGLPTEQQKAELLAILDRALALNLNAIILQVRPACDALYPSDLEPWSEYLTGSMGRAPEPFYDPLQFAVVEAHRRGLELHAWFNPYRAHHPSGKSAICSEHISRREPQLVRKYGAHLWLDPGDPAVQDHSLAVIRDVLLRYDIDGVHLDDYFYPYKEKGDDGQVLGFPDDPTWKRYRESGGRLARDDWRRQNVDRFIERLYGMIKEEKPWVRFGISPFGIWRPGNPSQIKGFDAYAELYADARKWFAEGWVDYFTPQLYWPIGQSAQSYPVLLRWWEEQNRRGRHLWAGNYTTRAGEGTWPKGEISEQIRLTRTEPGAGGNIHFSMKALMPESGAVPRELAAGVYAHQALAPASPWLDDDPPRAPRVRVRRGEDGPTRLITWSRPGGERVWLWVVQRCRQGEWSTVIVPAGQTSAPLDDGSASGGVDRIAVSAVDRVGNQGRPTVIDIGDE